MTDRRLRRGAFIGAEAMLRSAAKRPLSANEPELLAHAQWVHQEVRERALGRKLRLLAGHADRARSRRLTGPSAFSRCATVPGRDPRLPTLPVTAS